MQSKQELKERGHKAAVAFAENRGITVKEENWVCSYGTVDIIGVDGETLVFATVKTRKATAVGIPDTEMSEAAERRMRKCITKYTNEHDIKHSNIRVDMIAIYAFSETQALLRYVRGAIDMTTESE